jgi:two-component system, NarL family, nitrate/nitrite response regulator NarL
MTRLVLCDDQTILVESLAVALKARGYDVLAATTTPEECLSAVARYHPQVCLLDLYLPGREGGLETARAIRTAHPDTQVLILSCAADPQVLSAAISIGVAGIIRKDKAVDKIARALEQVATDGSIFQTDVVRDVVQHLASQPRKEPWDYLTAREREVLRRIVAGESTRQMARSMQIAASTVRTYVQNVLTKLGAHSRLEAWAIAVRSRLVDEPAYEPAHEPELLHKS